MSELKPHPPRHTAAIDSLAPKFMATVIAGVVVSGIYFGRPVLMPLALAVLMSFALAPLVSLFKHIRLGNVGSVVISLFFAVLVVAAGLALGPDRLAGAGPIGDPAGRQGHFQRVPVHPGEHQHFARGLALGDHRHQAVGVERHRRNKVGMGEMIGHDVSFSLARPFSRSATRSPASSRPAWMRSTGPSAANGLAVRLIWAGTIRLSNPPQE